MSRLHWSRLWTLTVVLVVLGVGGCPPRDQTNGNGNGNGDGGGNGNGGDGNGTTTPAAQLIQPANLRYLGAFRLPDRADGAPDAESWDYGGQALTYRPDGDPDGADDGYPGSLFGAGHDASHYVSEISIPAPATARAVNELPVATTLQGFHDLRGDLFDAFVEIPRIALQYVAAHGDEPARLHMAWGQHFQEDASVNIPSHAYCGLDLAHPNVQGAWWIDDQSLYSVNGYMFAIPQDWADAHTGGRTLATGRFRDGGWGGMGPALFAYAPWLDGNPPAAGAHLTARTLLLYSNTRGDDPTDVRLDHYQHSDEWEGGAWLTTADDRSAVIFAGTKGSGYLWYGFFSPAGDGMPCVEQHLTMVGCFTPEGEECPEAMQAECPGNVAASRGWWSSRFDAQVIFYDPAELAAVADGTAASSTPQPYATLDIDEHLFLNATTDAESIGTGDQRRFRLGETAYDRDRGLLYIPERFVDGAKPVIHVWAVAPAE
jgi:hypothetical protein